MATYFTADPHFGHANIIKYANRHAFTDVRHMNEELVRRWNALVKPGDDVYVLGDFAFCSSFDACVIAARLAGNKHLVFGNHDKKLRKEKRFLDCFNWAKDMAEIYVADADAVDGKQKIVLCHYAMRVWNKSHFGSWHLYGHSHGSLPDDPHALSLDVGVDCWDYAPVSYDEVKARMKRKKFVPVDHHDRRR